MKKILITGANSYIGTSFETYINENFSTEFSVDTLDMMDRSWRQYDFSKYDVVFHVAGIAHQKETKENVHIYYEVNTDLAIETATKAQKENIKQFVFLSSMSVYSLNGGCISLETLPNPTSTYGKSKLYAEEGILKLASTSFKIAIIRPPMIYGKGSKGNYSILAKFAKSAPIFPQYKNKRSMLYIENLCQFIKLIIDNNDTGYFYPQNAEYVNTSNMVYQIALNSGKHIFMTKLFNPLIWIFRKHRIIKKVFGDMYYEQSMSKYKENYNNVSFEKSIEKTNR